MTRARLAMAVSLVAASAACASIVGIDGVGYRGNADGGAEDAPSGDGALPEGATEAGGEGGSADAGADGDADPAAEYCLTNAIHDSFDDAATDAPPPFWGVSISAGPSYAVVASDGFSAPNRLLASANDGTVDLTRQTGIGSATHLRADFQLRVEEVQPASSSSAHLFSFYCDGSETLYMRLFLSGGTPHLEMNSGPLASGDFGDVAIAYGKWMHVLLTVDVTGSTADAGETANAVATVAFPGTGFSATGSASTGASSPCINPSVRLGAHTSGTKTSAVYTASFDDVTFCFAP
jgi:hypothetical protein